ncbi:MAG: type II toxin-antitoxin system HipA family toxin [Alphaproteobacteria bacterium]|jgi:serine/threonine-protein kinase HipA|nr:type II toxin-antitoxin system HipA family toxin [Alphaproteobacteria bacterium]
MTRILDVYLHEQLVGKLIQDNSGRLQFQYEENYVSDKNSMPISLSMPVRSEQYEEIKVRAFFSGLLPDDIARHRLARYLGVSEKNPFSLLEAIGGECAGALALYPEGELPPPPKNGDIEKLDNKQLKEILNLLKRRPLMAGEDNVRLSLAGAQDKLAISLVDDCIALVRGTTPTTHILKPLIEEVKDSVYNELFCLSLAALLEIETPRAEIRWLDDTPYFLVERYDRQIDSNNKIVRIHQEDFCQVLGVLPELKYEREGGPSVTQSLELLQNHSLQPAADRLAFIQRLIFNYLIGNSDAHGKNNSILFTNRLPRLAPAYDLLSTIIYPNLSNKMAMKIGGKYDPEVVLLRHWQRIVPDTTVAKRALNKDLMKISKDCLEQAHTLKAALKEQGTYSIIFDDICQVIKKRSDHILRQL